MTHTTTDAAEARALPVIQADRNAAGSLVPLCFGASAIWQSNVRAGYYDDGEIVQAFARHRLATAEAASGAGEADQTKADYCPGYCARGEPHNGSHDPVVLHRQSGGQTAEVFTASLPPATDPAMVTVPREDWDTAYRAFVGAFDTPLARRRHDDEYAADARRRLRDLDEALAAAPTIPATGEAMPNPAIEECARIAADEVTLAFGNIECGYRPAHNEGARETAERIERRIRALAATIPATGHAATEGEGA